MRGGVLVGGGVGVAGRDGTGTAVVGGGVVGGGAVGAAVAGAVGVGVLGEPSGDADAPRGEGVGAGAGLSVEITSGALVGELLLAGCAAPRASCVRLKPARARATARDGPRRTYRVKEARPPWPAARPAGFPTRPPTLGR